MKLEELYTNFMELSEEDQLASVAAYRLKRSQDLNKGASAKPPKKDSPIQITEEEKILMKLLGIKAKDLKALRDLQEDKTDTDDDDAAVLFDETGVSLGGDE